MNASSSPPVSISAAIDGGLDGHVQGEIALAPVPPNDPSTDAVAGLAGCDNGNVHCDGDGVVCE